MNTSNAKLPVDTERLVEMLRMNDPRMRRLDNDWSLFEAWKHDLSDYVYMASPDTFYEFGSGLNGVPFLGAGWSGSEPWGTWNDKAATIATLLMDNVEDKEYLLELKIVPYVAEGLVSQPISILVNSEELYNQTYTHSQTKGGAVTVEIPLPEGTLQNDKALKIEIRAGNTVSPKEFDSNSDDARKLGVALIYLEIKSL